MASHIFEIDFNQKKTFTIYRVNFICTSMIVGNASKINKSIILLIRLLCMIALLPAVILKATKKGFRLDKVYLFITP